MHSVIIFSKITCSCKDHCVIEELKSDHVDSHETSGNCGFVSESAKMRFVLLSLFKDCLVHHGELNCDCNFHFIQPGILFKVCKCFAYGY
jgi:hypothetical protein